MTDLATSHLDQASLAAAVRQSAGVRASRRSRQATIAGAFAKAALALLWLARPVSPDRVLVATDFARLEGASRPVLLDAGRSVYTGPGSFEGMP